MINIEGWGGCGKAGILVLCWQGYKCESKFVAELAVSIKFEIKPFGRTVSRSRYFHPKILSHDGYSAIKKDEILSFITTGMDVEGVMICEVNQRKANAVCFHLHVESKNKRWMNITETDPQIQRTHQWLQVKRCETKVGD